VPKIEHTKPVDPNYRCRKIYR